MCTYSLESFLRAVTGLRFALKVGTDETDSQNVKDLEAEAPAVVTCFENLPAYGEEPAPPPAFST